jgi:hypothetical protein
VWAFGAIWEFDNFCHVLRVTQVHQKFKHLFEFFLLFVSGRVFNCLIRTVVRNPAVTQQEMKSGVSDEHTKYQYIW